MDGWRDAVAVARALAVYRAKVVPLVRRELGRWREVAAAISDPVAREQALPAFRRAPDWQHAVHDTIEAMFHFGAEEPEYARLGGVEMYAAGKRALDSARS